MINVRVIANKAIQPVNPNIDAILKVSIGYTTDRTGKRAPAFEESTAKIQIQPLSGKEIMLIDGLEWQGGTFRAIHLTGNYSGLKRQKGAGADVLIFPEHKGAESSEWMVIQVMESWPTWCRLLVCQQNSTLQKMMSTQTLSSS